MTINMSNAADYVEVDGDFLGLYRLNFCKVIGFSSADGWYKLTQRPQLEMFKGEKINIVTILGSLKRMNNIIWIPPQKALLYMILVYNNPIGSS